MKNGMIERECLLFEAGDYPDRNLTISHADLIDIATNSPAALPVRVEHLPESPFDGALGTVVDLRADGGRLWGVLRQTEAAWDFVRQSGARALSIALDTAKQALTEVSFVTRPRVASAQVFSGMDSSIVHFDIDWKELDDMQGVKQFAEGIIQHIRSMAGGESGTLELERAHLEAEREALHRESATRKMEHFRQLGLVRPTDAAVGLAAAILGSGDGMIVTFGEARTSVAKLFADFLEANGPVIPLGEMMGASAPGGATQRLISLAEETSRREGIAYHAAFAREAGRHPELAREARVGSE